MEPHFIPSACWRKIARGILSTTRFAGVLAAHGKLYGVYDIGDGTMDWQLRAESSLFYHKYGSFETKADGMILVCTDGRRNEIAKQIIRQTMWSRRTLLKDQYAETDKPVRYSRSPIKLRAQYEHVCLTTPALLKTSLKRINGEEYHIEHAVKGGHQSHDPSQGDVEVYPNRYYLNPAFDFLKLVHFFAAVKGDKEYELTLRLRSQLLGALYDRIDFGSVPKRIVGEVSASQTDSVVCLTIPEPLPGLKELTGTVEDHWSRMIHEAIARQSKTGIPYFESPCSHPHHRSPGQP